MEFRCKCGYKETIPVGVGIRSIDTGIIKQVGLCPTCRRLISAPCKITEKNGKQELIPDPSGCPECHSLPLIFNDVTDVRCPLCNGVLSSEITGHWD